MLTKHILFLLLAQVILCAKFKEYSFLVDNYNFVTMWFIRLCRCVKHMECFILCHYNLNSLKNSHYFQWGGSYIFTCFSPCAHDKILVGSCKELIYKILEFLKFSFSVWKNPRIK